MAELLGDEALAQLLDTLPGWECDGASLRRSFVFEDFSEAWGFMARAALVAERLGHHPDWSNAWNTVEVAITSHELGGVSDLCVTLARGFDALVGHR